MQPKWNLEKVKKFIEQETDSGCILLSETYYHKDKLKIMCQCGEVFLTRFDKFLHRNKRQCNNCGYKKSMCDIEEVKTFLEEKTNSQVKLLSQEYEGWEKPLELLCHCGNKYITTWTALQNIRTVQCQECGISQGAKKRRYSYDYIKNYIEKNSDCKLLNRDYKSVSDRLILLCGCGREFSTTFTTFRRDNKRQCQWCTGVYWNFEMIKHFIEVESESGCTLLNDCSRHKNKAVIECSCGEVFKTAFSNFIGGKRHCNRCGSIAFSLEDVKEYVSANSDCELISTKYINVHTTLDFVCGCGKHFTTTLNSFKHANKRQCSWCSGVVSNGEKMVCKTLKNIGVGFMSEYSFEDCRSQHPLPFDFVIIDEHEVVLGAIEVDGQQHYYPVNFGGCSDKRAMSIHERTVKHDSIKNKYCKQNNIPLLRIPYWEFEDVEKTIKNYIYSLQKGGEMLE